jgi:Eukaryotic and archaeal DNA primase, large subunit
MTSRRLRPKEGEEIPISLLGIEHREESLWIALQPVPVDLFPPCIKNILSRTSSSTDGRHRAAAILAAFLGQAGWDEAAAKDLWKGVAERSGVQEQIFSGWFRRMHCPMCRTLSRSGRKYPHLDLAGLGFCHPDKMCKDFSGPLPYAAGLRTAEDLKKGKLHPIKSVIVARVFDWISGREGEIELSIEEKEALEKLLADDSDRHEMTLIFTRTKVRGRLKPRFFLKKEEGLRRRVLAEMLPGS